MPDWDLHENEESRKETISDYLDGDLLEEEERCVSDHIASCKDCNDYLNSLKLVSTSLEIMLGEESVAVPGEFSRRVAAAAESNVGGLRSSLEGFRPVWIVTVCLSLLVLLAGAGLANAGPSILEFSGRSFAFVGFIGNFLYKASLTFSMVFGTVCTKVLFGSTLALTALGFALIISLVIFSKHMAHFNRS